MDTLGDPATLSWCPHGVGRPDAWDMDEYISDPTDGPDKNCQLLILLNKIGVDTWNMSFGNPNVGHCNMFRARKVFCRSMYISPVGVFNDPVGMVRVTTCS